MIRYQDKENILKKNDQWPSHYFKSPLNQQNTYSQINKNQISNKINKSFILSNRKKFIFDNSRSTQKSRIQNRNQNCYNKSRILKNKIQNQDRIRYKLIEQFEAVQKFEQKPLNIDTKNRYVKFKDQKNGNNIINHDFMRLQQIRKENQKKMVELGLHPKRIYQGYYYKQEQQKVMDINQQKRSVINQRYSRNGLQKKQLNQTRNSFAQKERNQSFITQINYIVNQTNKFSDNFLNKFYQHQENSSNNQFKKQNILKQLKSNLQSGNQALAFYLYHKRKNYSQNKQNLIAHKDFKDFNKTDINLTDKSRVNDPRINSIDRITCKIKNLLKTMQKTKNIDINYFNKHKLSTVYDKQKVNNLFDYKIKQQYDKLNYEMQRKSYQNEQRNKKLKQLEIQRESKFQHWKKRVQSQNKADSKPLLNPYLLQQLNPGWDDDVKKIEQKLKKVQQQKLKLEKQTSQNTKHFNKESRITLNISRYSNTSKINRTFKKDFQQKKQAIYSLAILFKEQIQLDNKFRQEKWFFSICNYVNKWDKLKLQLKLTNIFLTQEQIKNIFHYSFQESNPFLESNINTVNITNLVKEYEATIKYFNYKIVSCRTQKHLLDIKNEFTKGDIMQLQDLVRFVNMQLNTFYRNRDLILFYRRFGEDPLSYNKFLDILSIKQ